MAIPASVEPFTEPETDHDPSTDLIARFLDVPLVKPFLLLALLAVLWSDAAREGVWGLPDPVEVFSHGGGYLLMLAAGIAVGLAWQRQSALAPALGADLPRLPVFLRFDHRRVVVVGGGAVAAAKIPALLAAGGDVTVIAPSVSADIDRARVLVRQRAFVPEDLDGAWFVTAAATPEVNRVVRDAAEVRGIFVNAVDDPPNATAYLGGTIARGGVTVAFSTAGEAPALAGLIREAFDELVPADIEAWVQRARELRTQQRADGVPMADRRPQLLLALNRLYDARERSTAER